MNVPREEAPFRWCGGPPWRRSGRGRGGARPGSGARPGPGGSGDRRRRVPWVSSAVVAVVVFVGTGFASRAHPDQQQLDAFARSLLLVGPVFLLLRVRWPLVALAGTVAAALVLQAAGCAYGAVFLPVVVATFRAVVTGRLRAASWTCAVLLAGHVLIGQWLYRYLPPSGDRSGPWGEELYFAVWVVAVLAGSEVVRVRREAWARERMERAAAARRRADEERLRIARELHDVLAHSISVINVQAGVGLALLDSDPEQARTALTTIKAASKEALGEVRQVLEGLRAPGEAPRAPAPGLDRLPELADQAAGAGLSVTVDTEGTPRPLPPGADLAAFRIVQEALTNVVRHSGSRVARVRLGYGPARLTLRVDDDGPATGTDAGGSGNGLAGMRERAAALGGRIEAGTRPDGGFGVLAELPVPRREPRCGAAASAPPHRGGRTAVPPDETKETS
ncbi:sensor histidine kinase [Streptomyces sp. NPDC057638]|uniref:sensor histidine kinase n=1 Tax=Streptomyces sp. NPDC057638 TaxID=3346190 RepID=UPI0036AEFD09